MARPVPLALSTMRAGPTKFYSFRLLEGTPKVGKTTVVERLIKLLVGVGVPVGGFVTREVLGPRRAATWLQSL
jgi:hypothetical protein